MKPRLRQDKAWLLSNARSVAQKLRTLSEGTRLRVRIPRRASPTETDGWFTIVADLGRGQPRLEIWFDRITGYPQRKFYAGFYAPERTTITALTRRVSRKLWPIRTVGHSDTIKGRYLVFSTRLQRSEFNEPVLEKYLRGSTFYGIYDPTRATSEKENCHFCNRAISFFEDVVRALPNGSAEDGRGEVYPRYENRKRVISHIQRERSGLLAAERKIRDDYKCQVCRFQFEKAYGRLGIEFAEAHHRIPLSQLRENRRTRIEDLITVCANCHRMLHRMAGGRDHIVKLRAIVRTRRAQGAWRQ